MGPTQRRESPATAMPVLHSTGEPKRSLVVCLITRLIARSWRRLQTVYVLGIAIRDDSNDQGRQLAQRAYEALDRGALDELSWLYTPDIEMITPDETVKGIDDVRAFFEAVRTAFPDISHRWLAPSNPRVSSPASGWCLALTSAHLPLRTARFLPPVSLSKSPWPTS
jgi:hypothetical protein